MAIASAATQAQDWAAAMTAAKLCALQDPKGAADIVADIVQGLSSSDSTVTLAAEGMPVSQKAGRHAEVVKVHHMPSHMANRAHAFVHKLPGGYAFKADLILPQASM